MGDDVIRNPLRSIPKVQQHYEPEYVRKNVEPIPAPTETAAGRLSNEFYSAVDDDIFDENDNQIQNIGSFIDNNDYVFPEDRSKQDVKQIRQQEQKPPPTDENVAAPNVGDYILMIFGKLILSGSIERIQTKIQNIMYGDDKDFKGVEVNADDIVVLKRLAIKIGIFVDG